jgi:hypothetical protein
MAHPSKKIVETLRKTADKILESHDYQWGHMGACNCGYLAQSITMKSKAEIHKRAMFGNGDWNEQLNDYCSTSGLPLDEVVSEMLDLGFDIDDLKHLERLSDKRVLSRMPFPAYLKQNVKEDVALYMTLWSDLIEEELRAQKQRMRNFDRELAIV